MLIRVVSFECFAHRFRFFSLLLFFNWTFGNIFIFIDCLVLLHDKKNPCLKEQISLLSAIFNWQSWNRKKCINFLGLQCLRNSSEQAYYGDYKRKILEADLECVLVTKIPKWIQTSQSFDAFQMIGFGNYQYICPFLLEIKA